MGFELLWVEVFLQQSPRTQYPLLAVTGPQTHPCISTRSSDNVVTKNILGDFNAKHQEWCSRDLTTRHGNVLKNLMGSYGLTQLCTVNQTHLNHGGKPNSLLDLVFTNDTDTFHFQWTFSHLSVHQTIYLLLSTTVLPKIIFLYNPYPSKKKHNNMAKAFIFENWQHVFEPSLNINEPWDRWKEKFFKEVKSFIGHEIRNDNHEKTTSKSAKWFNKDICRLIRAKNRLYHRATLGRAAIGRFTVLLAIKQLTLSELPRQNFKIRKLKPWRTQTVLHPSGGNWPKNSVI